MRYSCSTLIAATLLFARHVVPLPTSNSVAAATHSLPNVLEWLGDNSRWEKRAITAGSTSQTEQKVPLCKLDKIKVPIGEGTTKLTGAGSLKLKLVVIGHGTQNYTCSDSTANTKPVANGAYAELYDASCFALYAPAILNWLPYLFLHKPKAIPEDLIPKVGIHYFHPDASTPVFDIIESNTSNKKGRFVGKKLENIPAPVSADTGVTPDAFGAVDWLKLGDKEKVKTSSGEVLSSKGYKTVYRVHTAGGKPPATCEGRPEQFEVLYGTQYWLFD